MFLRYSFSKSCDFIIIKEKFTLLNFLWAKNLHISEKICTFVLDLKKDLKKIYPSMTLTTNSMFNFTPPHEWTQHKEYQ